VKNNAQPLYATAGQHINIHLTQKGQLIAEKFSVNGGNATLAVIVFNADYYVKFA
jgi:hypothetical protein